MMFIYLHTNRIEVIGWFLNMPHQKKISNFDAQSLVYFLQRLYCSMIHKGLVRGSSQVKIFLIKILGANTVD